MHIACLTILALNTSQQLSFIAAGCWRWFCWPGGWHTHSAPESWSSCYRGWGSWNILSSLDLWSHSAWISGIRTIYWIESEMKKMQCALQTEECIVCISNCQPCWPSSLLILTGRLSYFLGKKSIRGHQFLISTFLHLIAANRLVLELVADRLDQQFLFVN